MRYLITGHTGFKGSWLAAMLKLQGHEVCGISLSPENKSHYIAANISQYIDHEYIIDIRNRFELELAFEELKPDIIIHLAAQSLVRESYKNPIGTYETNVIGTLNTLEATKKLDSLKAVLVITTDKVYKNHNKIRGYVETDELGGDDPYSASKSAADIAAQSWIKSYGTIPISIARAGNVIGGGDWASDRLIPDLIKAYSSGKLPILRYPSAIRPWQHVLECLYGYLKLIDQMLKENTQGQWNFGPPVQNKFTVGEVAEQIGKRFGVIGNYWIPEMESQPHESEYLLLDSSKSRKELLWGDILSFQETIQWTVDWYRQFYESSTDLTTSQIQEYFNRLHAN